MSAKKKGFNKYEIRGDITVIFLENKDGLKLEAIIDTEDLEKIRGLGYHWHININRRKDNIHVLSTVYQGMIEGKAKYKIHTLHSHIIESHPEEGEYIDHIDGDGLNNRKENLRIITNKGNTINRKGANRNNKSGYRNVCWLKDESVWIVQLYINNKNIVMGRFNDVHEAGRFAEKMRNKYYNKIIEEETILSLV